MTGDDFLLVRYWLNMDLLCWQDSCVQSVGNVVLSVHLTANYISL